MTDEYGPVIPWSGYGSPPTGDVMAWRRWGCTSFAAGPDLEWRHTGDESDIIAYRVKIEPVVETVRRPMRTLPCGTACFSQSHERIDGYFVHETRDGKPDMTTLRWEDAT